MNRDPDSVAYTQMSFELAAAVHAYLARSAAALMAVQAEDLLSMRDPVNLPGTSTEHPNWQRKLSRDVDALFASGAVQALCRLASAPSAGNGDIPHSPARTGEGGYRGLEGK